MNKQSEFEKTKNQFYDNYKTSGMFSISLLLLSYSLITTKRGGDYDFSTGMRVVGVLTLPATVLLTPITLAAGALGALGNTAWGAVSLPLAAARDSKVKKESAPEKASELTPSTKTMLQQTTLSQEKGKTLESEGRPDHIPFITDTLLKRPVSSNHNKLDSGLPADVTLNLRS